MILRVLFFLAQGSTLAFPAAMMPGPYQAFLIAQALKNGWKRTLPAALAPLITDGPIIALVLFVLRQTPQGFLNVLRTAGGLFLLYLAFGIVRTLRQPSQPLEPDLKAGRQTLFKALIVNILNPNPYIFWGMAAGPVMLSGWREAPALGISFIAGFYITFVLGLSAFIIVFATVGRLSPRTTLYLRFFSGLALAFFGIYQVWVGANALL